MKERKHSFIFKKRITIGYRYKDYTSDLEKKIMQENCLESIRKRFQWLLELSDKELLTHLIQEDKKCRNKF